MDSLGPLLLEYYRTHPRALPWRSEPTPYHVWVSEIMLQQTRVEAVRGYYSRFLEAFPTVADFASASEEEVLKQWEGLGYYSRARNMQKAAKAIVEDGGGSFPETYEGWLALPGIGPYTAAAVSAIAFHLPRAAVDGNLVRVASRLFATPWSSKTETDKKKVAAVLEGEMNIDPAVFNQALMDIGQTICIPRGAPLCGECPLKRICLAHRQGNELSFPVVAPSKKRREEKRTILLLRNGGRIFLQQRPSSGLLASMFEPLNLLGEMSEEEIRVELEKRGYVPVKIEDLGGARHVFSHVEWQMRGYLIDVAEIPDGACFASEEEREAKYPIPSAFRAYLP